MGKQEPKKEEKRERVKPGLRQCIYAGIACVSTLLFTIWTDYWAVLILIPVFFDIYITKFVNWGGWKEAKNPKVRKVLDWVDAILFALVGVYFINTFFFQNYQIPSSSLEKSLLVGDFLCVSKLSYGARSPMTPLSFPLMQHTFPVLETKSYSEKPQLDYKRFPGGEPISRYDIVVFNYPSGDTVALNAQNSDYYVMCKAESRGKIWNDKARYGEIVYRPVDRRENYVKRCVGLPGDYLEVRDDIVYINGEALTQPENAQQNYFVQTKSVEISQRVFEELGVSAEDRSARIDPLWYMEDTNLKISSFVNAGFKYEDGSFGYFYAIPLTKKMVEQLKAKPFVSNVVSYNSFYKKAKVKRLELYPADFVYPITYKQDAYPGDFPKIWIPKRGATINFTKNPEYCYAAYLRCIKNYEGNEMELRDGKIYINGQQTDTYTFKLDYYFMMGDNRDNSADSRSWGFVPEDHIVGRPLFIWLSLDKDKGWFSGKIRWNRLFTSGNKNK